MTHDIIERDGKPFVLVPKAAYERMRAALEDRDDVRAYDAAKAARREMVPATIVDRLLAGENAIRVWREHRELSQQQLADAGGISKPYLSQLENGVRTGKIGVLRKLAAALRLDLEDLAPNTAGRKSSAKKPARKRTAKAGTRGRKTAYPR
jgi:DNA-binding XRE family transcriptional regulator